MRNVRHMNFSSLCCNLTDKSDKPSKVHKVVDVVVFLLLCFPYHLLMDTSHFMHKRNKIKLEHSSCKQMQKH